MDAPQIQTTLGVLAGVAEPLGRLTTLRLPAASAYHVARLARLVNVEIDHVNEQRVATIRELGRPRPATDAERANGSEAEVTEVAPERRAEFQTRMTELAAVPVTIAAAPVRLTVAALNGCTISAADLLALDPLVVLEVEAGP